MKHGLVDEYLTLLPSPTGRSDVGVCVFVWYAGSRLSRVDVVSGRLTPCEYEVNEEGHR